MKRSKPIQPPAASIRAAMSRLSAALPQCLGRRNGQQGCDSGSQCFTVRRLRSGPGRTFPDASSPANAPLPIRHAPKWLRARARTACGRRLRAIRACSCENYRALAGRSARYTRRFAMQSGSRAVDQPQPEQRGPLPWYCTMNSCCSASSSMICHSTQASMIAPIGRSASSRMTSA